jgi:site-specific DNA recombinase
MMATAVAGSPLAGFAGSDDVAAAWDAASVSRRKAVIDVLMTVTLLPAPRGRRPGGHYFDPGSINVEWKVGV